MKSRILRAALLAMASTLVAAVFLAVPAEAAPGVTITVFKCTSSDCSSKTQVSSGPVSGFLQIQAKPSVSGLLPPALKSLDITIKPASSSSIACIYHLASPHSGTVYSVNWNSTAYPNAPSGCSTSSLDGTLTRNESVVFTARATDTNNASASASVSALSLNNPPTPPQWAASPSVSGASKNAPVVTLKWNASPEPDIQEYRFLRTDPSGNTKQYPVDAASPSAQGCSFAGTTYTCYDTDFPSTGFGGTYSYALTAYRSSPSQADTCYYPNQQTPCIGATSNDVRQVSIVEPSPSPSATGGTGGGGTGGGTGGGGTGGGNGTVGGGAGSVPTGVPSVATPSQTHGPTSVQGQTFNPGDCFTCGTYKETLPYGSLPGDGQSGTFAPQPGQGPALAAGSGIGSGSSGPDPRQLWVSMAAGLVLLLTAGHVARVLRTTAR
jgi:hypothetical protein